MQLEGKVALITGGGSGIGRAIALGYAREGAQVVLLDMNEKAAAEAAREIRSAGGKAESFALDVTQRDDCIATAKQIAGKVGPVSILVNNAGIAPPLASSSRRALFGVEQVSCPQCGSKNTEVLSEFGSTSCKALWRCKNCREPFDYFKCH